MICSGTGRPVCPIENLETVPTTEHDMLRDWSTSLPNRQSGDCTDHRARYAQGLVDQFAQSTIWGLYRPPSMICSGIGRPIPPIRLAVSIQSQTSVMRPRLRKSNCIMSNRIILTILILLQGSYYIFQQARGLHRYDASGDVS